MKGEKCNHQEEWEPSDSDVQWISNTCASIAEGGAWVVPISQSVWVIWNDAKKAKLNAGNASNTTNQRIIKTLKKMQFKIEL